MARQRSVVAGAVELRLKLAESAHELPAFDAPILVNIKAIEDGLGVEQIERESQRVERRSELRDVERAGA